MLHSVIHQIWLGKKPFPSDADRWVSTLRSLHPDWTYRLWTDADLADLEPRLLCPHLVMDPELGFGIRCDVLRFELIRLFGGLYLDHDMEVFQPLDELILDDCLHIGLSFNSVDAVSTAIFGSPAGHPFWDFYLGRLRESVPPRRPEDPWDVLHLTGYKALVSALHEWLKGNYLARELSRPDGFVAGWLFEHADLVLWSREAVHPYHVGELAFDDFRRKDFPNAYAAHHWQGEWFAEHAEVISLKNAAAP